jgi:[ribosomal protein S18]-alanine N-acetyltransferase
MTIREYTPEDKNACLEIFRSNCPKFFDKSELEMFDKWLEHQANENSVYQSPTYTNSEKDAYYVIELPETGIVACAGFYIVKNEKEARLAWGMIHSSFHNKGYGTTLFDHRKKIIQKNWPQHKITLGTSQHTFPFYERMGMKVINFVKSGYGPELDRYDMIL